MRIVRSLVMAATLSSLAGAAFAQDAGMAAIGARQALMKMQAYYLGQLGMMAQGKVPYDAKAAAIAANGLEAISSVDFGSLFPKGTDNAAEPKSKALPAAWASMDDFVAKYGDLHKASLTLQAQAGNGLDALKANFGPVAGTCGACHKEYRAAN